MLNFRTTRDQSRDIPVSSVTVIDASLQAASLQNQPINSSSELSQMSNFIIKDTVSRAEIIWALNKVTTHSSDRSVSVSADLFPVMFPDSPIAKQFKMQKDKLSYMIAYGLGPFFQNALAEKVKQCDFYSVSIDESLNRISQKGQMDVIVRYWNDSDDQVSTRYLTSAFLGHSTANDLLSAFTSSISELGLSFKKIIQIAMDGPNVNLKFLQDFKYHLNAESPSTNSEEIIDVGTCSLHAVHGSYKTALKKCEWDLCKFLRALYYYFKDFPSRRADYIRYTGSSVFPLKICSIRWVENVGVIERAVKMIPYLRKYVKAINSNPPNSQNFITMQQFLNDKLLSAKLLFLQSVALELQPFLTHFQSDKPVLPFLYQEMYAMTQSIARRFLKKDVIGSIKNARQLIKIDVQNKKNQLTIADVEIGFGAVHACKGAKDLDIIVFRRDCRDFLISMFTKLTDKKSSLHKPIVIGASCLSPVVMLNQSLRNSRIKIALEELILKNHIAPTEADIVKRDYLTVCEKVDNHKKFKAFDWKKDRLDALVLSLLESKHTPLLKFAQKIFVMFHGNAAVERGFSINKECLVENLHEHSLIAQRSVYSAVLSSGGIKNINITKGMITAVRHAGTKRNQALADKKHQKNEKACEIKRVSEELKTLKERKKRLLEVAEQEAQEIESEIVAAEKRIKMF